MVIAVLSTHSGTRSDNPLRNAAAKFRRTVQTVADTGEPLSVRRGRAAHRRRPAVRRSLPGRRGIRSGTRHPIAGSRWIDPSDPVALGSPEWAEVVSYRSRKLFRENRIGVYGRRAAPFPDRLREDRPLARFRGHREDPGEVMDETLPSLRGHDTHPRKLVQ
jgi:hypothetical protein